MEQTITPEQVHGIVEALLDFIRHDVARVKAFYIDSDPKMRGLTPLMDAVLDGVDHWLMNHWKLPDIDYNEVVVYDKEGKRHTRNLSDVEWD